MALTGPEDLFVAHRGEVYRYLLRMTRREDVAADLTQETFLRVVRAQRNGQVVGHARGWVFAIARNLLRDHASAERARVTESLGEREFARPHTQALAFGLDEALARLSVEDREVFLLREIAGLSYADIASMCGCSAESVRSRLFRVRTSLRDTLTREP